MRLDELRQPGLGDAADNFCETDMKYGMTKLKICAVVKPQTDMSTPTPLRKTFADLMQPHDIVPGQSNMPQVTF
jgi:hypothetical protein